MNMIMNMNLFIFTLLIGLSYADNIKLTEFNHVTIRGPITDNSIGKIIFKINKIETDDIYIYIQSPGGSVDSGYTFIQQMDYLKNTGKNIKCITDISHSMAFIILQNCNERYATISSIAMQHQIFFSLKGYIKNVESRMNLIESISEKLDVFQAKKIGITTEQFREKIQHDWWIAGDNLVKENIVDKMVTVGCSSSLFKKKNTENFSTPYGNVKLILSGCPLIRNPIREIFDDDYSNDIKNKIRKSYNIYYVT